jgi:EpsD family peptidyl-prolyl cis-trans isomerase
MFIMFLSLSHSRGAALILSLACVTLLSAGCNKSDKKSSPSQVAFKVNGEEVSVHQVALARQRAGQGAQSEAGSRRVVETLVDQELTAQAARKDGLEQDPNVVQLMEQAKRDVLARVYLERLSSKVNEPSTDEIDRYYNEHPNLFSDRRLFTLQETQVEAPADRAEALAAKLKATQGVDKLIETIRADSLRSSTRQSSMSAEDVPLVLLDQLAALQVGQSVVLPAEGSLRVLTLLSSQSAPVARGTATRLISIFLVNERKRQLIDTSVKALRAAAKVEFPAASGAASAPAAAASK